MQFNPQNLIPFGTFIFSGLVAMKMKKKMLGWALIIISVVILAAILFWPESDSKSDHVPEIAVTTYGNSSPAAVTTGSNSPINISIGQAQPILDTKKDLRALFATANPEIITMIDAGSNTIPVMLGTVARVRLSELTSRPDFKKYISLQTTGNVIMGGTSNSIGDFINDIGENGEMTGFVFFPTDALKGN